MTAGQEDFRPKRRELALPDETANFSGISDPKWDLNSIVGDTRAPKVDLARFRSALVPAITRDGQRMPLLSDRVTLSSQLSRTLRQVRESVENARRPSQTGRISEASLEREQAERKKDQQIKAAEVSKKAKSMIALLKSNPDAVAKLAAIVDSPQGQGFPEVFASIILDNDQAKPEQKTDIELATRAATELASTNPEFAAKLANALIAQAAPDAQINMAQYEPVTDPGQNLVQTKGEQLAQILSEPNNKVLLDSVVQTALAEPAKAENAVVLQEIARLPQIAEALSNLSVAQVPLAQPTLEQPRSIQVASLDDNFAFAQTFDTTNTLDPQTRPVNFTQVADASTLVSSYSFSADLPQRIESLRTMINNFTPPDAATTASTFAAAPLEIPFKQAVQAELYTNQNSSIEQIRDNLVTKLGINQTSKFTLEIQPVGTERTLVLVPTQALIQERPEMAVVKMPSVTESEIQTAKVEVQKLNKFIADINNTAEVSVASRFADFARTSTNSLGTVLAFRQVIMTMAKNSNMSGLDLALKVKDELNMALVGSNLTVSSEANSILLNTISESTDTSPKTLASISFEEAPAGSLSAGQIEQIKTAMVSALNDPFKLALLEQKLLQNGVMQSDIDALKVRAIESGNVNQEITDAQATERIRNDLKNLVSHDRNDRILAAEDLRQNNITGLSVGGGEVGFSIDKVDTATSVKVMIPGQQPQENPISIEMFAYGGYDADNRDSERMEELADAFLPLEYSNLPLQVLDKFGNAFTVSSQSDYRYGEAGTSEDENMYDENVNINPNADPNFNPFDYVNPNPGQMRSLDQYQDDPEQEYDPEQEFDQELDQEQDQYQQQEEILPEYEEPYSDSEPYEEQ